MKNTLTFCLLLLGGWHLNAQQASIIGQLQDPEGGAITYANVALYHALDSTLAKVETTDESGVFRMVGIQPGGYFLVASYVGADDLRKEGLQLTSGQQLDLGVLRFASTAVELVEATVTAARPMVEVKPDRTVFNVQGTINSTGADALSLLRKAPGVTVDNNNNISVLGRAGVLLYVDGKRLPITGEALTAYLQNLPADQIDRFDIITNPGAKYEAEGNAGIIDIRLKKDKNLGGNGSLSGTFSQGRYARINGSASGNYRNKWMNGFGTLGANGNEGYSNMDFFSRQNGLELDEINRFTNQNRGVNLRVGTDFFLNNQHTVGFLVSANTNQGDNASFNRIRIADVATPNIIDSVLISDNTAESENEQLTANLNYRFDAGKGTSFNLDLDYGRYLNDIYRVQPNRYYDTEGGTLLTEIINTFDTPTDIDIYTAKADYEMNVLGGKLGLGSKLSRVVSDNTFLVFDLLNQIEVQNDTLSNTFAYTENVYAGYVNYSRPITEKWSFVAGLRAEQTDAKGDLRAFLPSLMAPPVYLNYLSWFPNAGLTWQMAPEHTFSLNYGRRINRPDYNVLNPFNNRLSQLSYEKGNPFLRPEIVNNVELSYTLKYRFNFKLGYSKTIDQITRLIGPDENDERANFITWENLASQTITSLNISAPFQVMKGWSSYWNISAAYLDNQADYGNGAVVDVQAFTYSFFQQQTIDLPRGFKGEISGYFAGPGVWGGVFKYESSWSLDLGLQKKFLNDQLNARLSASDLFYETGWDGDSVFNGLESYGKGNWDSRRISLSLSYNFGNQQVKSRRRNTGIEDEAKRLGN
ncbi:MAG: TonB-dependent receptor [Saprospiraceae bacterium]